MENIRNKVFLNNLSEDVEKNMLEIRDLTKKEALGLLLAGGEFEENVEHYKNLNKGIDFLLNAMANDENISIQVDSDADGYLSGALVYQVIYDDFEYENVTFILNEGREHGFQLKNLDALIENDIKLLIIPDGGSVEFEPLKQVTDKGIKVLILDHHIIEIGEELKDIEENVALINNQDGSVENIYLSGCGVSYKFCKELIECCEGAIGNKYLDLVATSLISDMCDMKYSYENRYYLNIGSKIANVTNPFLIEMARSMKKSKKDRFTIEDFGFSIAPIINATIRIGKKEDKENLFNALIGVNDLIAHRGKAISYPSKSRLIGANLQKKQKEEKVKIAEMVKKEIEEEGSQNNTVIIYIDREKKIDKSLRGLTCNQLLDYYERPILLGSIDKNGFVRGSARGYGEMDFKYICEGTGLFEYCNGHDNAFGFSIKEDKIEEFLKYVNDNITIKEKSINVEKIYDEFVPKDDVKKIVSYENLWSHDIKPPLYLIKNAIFKVGDIKKIGNSTYEFENKDIKITKYFCSKKAFEELVEEKQDDDYVTLDALVEFRYKFGRKIIIKDWEKIK